MIACVLVVREFGSGPGSEVEKKSDEGLWFWFEEGFALRDVRGRDGSRGFPPLPYFRGRFPLFSFLSLLARVVSFCLCWAGSAPDRVVCISECVDPAPHLGMARWGELRLPRPLLLFSLPISGAFVSLVSCFFLLFFLVF